MLQHSYDELKGRAVNTLVPAEKRVVLAYQLWQDGTDNEFTALECALMVPDEQLSTQLSTVFNITDTTIL
jgi:hypothetical protein